jgi:hypothetical protein
MRPFTAILLLMPVAAGCSEQPSPQAAINLNSLKQVGLASHDTAQSPPGGDTNARGEQSAGLQTTAAQPTAGRQIIYRASLNLHVQNFGETDKKITTLVGDAGGFVSQFSEDRSYGTQRGGRWTVRIPFDKFSWFLDEVGQLGVAERREVQSQDVTEEYIDLQSRLKNKQALEARLLELVANRGDAIKDVLALEGELSRVREEIERLQGRIRFLSDRVALTTVEIAAYERLDYQPPEATFAQRLYSTLMLSADRLRQLGESVVLALAAILPWLLAVLLLVLPVAAFILFRRLLRLISVPS